MTEEITPREAKRFHIHRYVFGKRLYVFSIAIQSIQFCIYYRALHSSAMLSKIEFGEFRFAPNASLISVRNNILF